MDFSQQLRTLRYQEEVFIFLKTLPKGRRIVMKVNHQEVYGFQGVPYIVDRIWYCYRMNENLVKLGECDVPHMWRHMKVV